MRIVFVLIVFLTIFVGCLTASAQPSQPRMANQHSYSAAITLNDTVLQLPHQFILVGTDTVWLDTIQLDRTKDYIIDHRLGTLSFKQEMLCSLQVDSIGEHKILVRYHALPFSFRQSYRHREPIVWKDSVTGVERKVVKPVSTFSVDDLFGTNLQKSGSIVRGFTIGTNRDLSLMSGFRMQMSGNISDDVEVVAALTDENTPIQPEGTTQTLQEVDKVFIEVRGSGLTATAGDFHLSSTGNEFGQFNRKVQGAKGTANYQTGFNRGDVLLAGAVSRGKFTTNQFQGIEGIQGPYRLVGQNNVRDIIVIAGTERVYVNGIQMTRGMLSDYVIDYASAEITFTSNRLITHASRIVVDFEYADRQFSRNLFAVKSGSAFFDEKVHLNGFFIRESDDKDAPIDIALSDNDKDILKSAGDNRFNSSRSGVEVVGSGKGQYIRVDTLIISPLSGDTALYTLYRYAPEDTINAIYAVTFSYVGEGQGDYNKIGVGRYEFVGIGKGAYVPIKFLPMPQNHTLIDFDAAIKPMNDVKIHVEYAVSNFDANRFSSLDDGDNNGSAVKLELQYSPKDVKLGKVNIGSFDLGFKERFVHKDFVSIDRINEIEFNRKWNIINISRVDEEIREGRLSYFPLKQVRFDGGLGLIKRGGTFTSNRYAAGAHLVDEHLPSANYELEIIKSNNNQLGISSRWLRHRAEGEYKISTVASGLRFVHEIRRESNPPLDTLMSESFRFNEIAPRLTINDVALMSLSSEFSWQWDDSLSNKTLKRASNTFTQQYNWKLPEWNTLSSTFNIVLRSRKFTNEFKEKNNADTRTTLIRSQTRYTPLNRGVETDLYYEVASQRTAKFERVFQRVPKGTGNYIYLGDINRNNTVDEADFQPVRFDGEFVSILVPSEHYIPVTELKTSVRLRLHGDRLFARTSWLMKTLSAFSTETYARVEEKSSETDTRQIYFLNFSRFLNESVTLDGSNLFSQEIFILENNPDISFRLRFLQRRGFTKFTLQDERTYMRERSVRVRWHLVKEIVQQTDYIQKNDILSSTHYSNRLRNIVSHNVIMDWSYRPYQEVEVGFGFGVGRASNFDSVSADLNTQSVRFIYSFEGKGQARVEFSREEIFLDRQSIIMPYELTAGRVEGKTWLWRLAMDYRITQFLQSTVSYDGRIEGRKVPIHSGQAEVRAFF